MLEDFGADLIINRLQGAGFEAYYVGGCVRNYLLGKPIDDYDLTTSAPPQVICNLFNDFKYFTTGIKHGTVSIIVNEKVYEVTTFRSDGEYIDSRHPLSVSFCSSIIKDLSRRDFTINAIAFNKNVGFIDNFNGIYDIEAGVVKCVGDANVRFSEDALRILRALRFASVYSLKIEEQTGAALIDNVHLLKNISVERISIELEKTILGENALNILNDYKEVFFEIIPHLKSVSDLNYVLSVIVASPRKIDLRYAALFYFLKEHFAEISSRLKLNNKLKAKISLLISTHDSDLSTKASIKELLKIFEDEIFDFFDYELAFATASSDENKVFKIENARIIASEILNNGDCYSLKQLAVNGSDLLELGYKGKAIQDCLNLLLDAVIYDRIINNKNSLIKYLIENNG